MKTLIRIFLLIPLLYVTTAFSHETVEIDGLSVLFGGEPEPMLDGERQYLRWRFIDTKTNEPASDLEDLQATITIDGKEFGPFKARGSRRDPGAYQTLHIFTKAGEAEATLSFKRSGKDKVNKLVTSFTVRSRKTLEVP